jgi:SHS2 domain-containing protein
MVERREIMGKVNARRGHRSLPHTADLRIEAWGPTREECLAEAVMGLVDSFADVGGLAESAGNGVVRCHLTGETDADLAAQALEEVIYHLDTGGLIPVRATAHPGADGGIDLILVMADAGTVDIIGAGPKAVSLSGLRLAPVTSGLGTAGGWRGTITVDV